jgi:hypothetical protein
MTPIAWGLQLISRHEATFWSTPWCCLGGVVSFVEYLLLLRGWRASLRPPTICAKSYKAYNVSTCNYRIKQQNGMSLAAYAWDKNPLHSIKNKKRLLFSAILPADVLNLRWPLLTESADWKMHGKDFRWDVCDTTAAWKLIISSWEHKIHESAFAILNTKIYTMDCKKQLLVKFNTLQSILLLTQLFNLRYNKLHHGEISNFLCIVQTDAMAKDSPLVADWFREQCASGHAVSAMSSDSFSEWPQSLQFTCSGSLCFSDQHNNFFRNHIVIGMTKNPQFLTPMWWIGAGKDNISYFVDIII